MNSVREDIFKDIANEGQRVLWESVRVFSEAEQKSMHERYRESWGVCDLVSTHILIGKV